MKYLLIYGIVINLITFLIYGIDKRYAMKSNKRISENTLFIFSIIGGFIGSILGMKIFHHKTRKIKFYLINILAIIIWIGGLYGFRGLFT